MVRAEDVFQFEFNPTFEFHVAWESVPHQLPTPATTPATATP